MSKSEALRLADELEDDLADYGGQSLPRISQDIADNAAAELRRLHAENASLSAALASFCDEQRHELWESGGVAGCERARVAERQRDALLEANESFDKRQQWWNEKMFTLEQQRDALLEALKEVLAWGTDQNYVRAEAACDKARAAIKAVEGTK